MAAPEPKLAADVWAKINTAKNAAERASDEKTIIRDDRNILRLQKHGGCLRMKAFVIGVAFSIVIALCPAIVVSVLFGLVAVSILKAPGGR